MLFPFPYCFAYSFVLSVAAGILSKNAKHATVLGDMVNVAA